METSDSADHEVEGLKKFTQWIDNFCEDVNLIDHKDHEEFSQILNIAPEDILSLSSDECFANAIVLMNYASILQKRLDLINSQYAWCVEALNYLFAKQWSSYDQYLPAEIKKQAIIAENSYAQSVEKSRLRLYASKQLLSETCKDVKKRVTLFQDLGKSRNYK